MEIINPKNSDYHSHTITFSDGMNTVEEMVIMAGKIGLETLALTDHSQAALDVSNYAKKTHRSNTQRWQNIHNDVNVIFGVEGDLLDENGNICIDIGGYVADFAILSAHKEIYAGDIANITSAYIKAIKKHHEKIAFLGHPCIFHFEKHIDIETITKAANDYGIAMELNCSNLKNGKTNLANLEKMLILADRIYVNSDAHTLYTLKTNREAGFKYLKEKGFI